MPTLLSLPVAAVVLFGALFGGGGRPTPPPDAVTPRSASDEVLGLPLEEPRAKAEVWATRAWPLHVRNPNTNRTADVRVYTDLGKVDPEALRAFVAVVNPDGEPLEPRVLLLVARAAYALGASGVEVISGHRQEARGTSRHHTDEALDFKLDRVDSGLLAAHLRGYGHVGVGVYTHPRTHYVHLDTREKSFHWIDASPPGKTWRE
ncbi:MAG TPA: hypothetical protein PK141_26315, partial [Polyangiaceae bacterium]|nr:hypothetical protein [Polyangiaceae bacterium]